MKKHPNPTRTAPMNPDAYAGFLKLWLSPFSRIPKPSPEIDAYIQYVDEREPLPACMAEMGGLRTDRAA